MSGAMYSIWAVYKGATDYPEGAVARRFDIFPGRAVATREVVVGDSVDDVRSKLPAGLVRIPRADVDEPQIVEVWL